MANATLQRLLHPHTVAEFFANTWEQTHLHVPREQNLDLQTYLDALISIEDLDHLLTTTYAAGLRPPGAVRMGQGGVVIPPSEFSFDHDPAFAKIDVDRVLSLYRNGASIILNNVHESFGPMAELCNELSQVFGVSVHANAYITPPLSQGFPLHFDTHDVFLLQIAGEKHWNLYPSTLSLATPRMSQEAASKRPNGVATAVHLRHGELLYLPRGLLHEGVASEQTSFHMTIGIEAYAWSHLIQDVVLELESEDVEFRRSVAAQLTRLDMQCPQMRQTLARLSERLFDPSRVRCAAQRKAGVVHQRRRSDLRGRLEQMIRSRGISLASVVRLRTGTDVQLQAFQTHVEIAFNGKTLTLPSFTEPHLRALCSGKPVSIADVPSNLEDDGKLVLIRRLVDEGLLESVKL